MASYPIYYRRLLHGARGTCLERTRLPRKAAYRWEAGAAAVRIRFDIGVEGWFRAGPIKRLKREGTYEKLRRDPAGILAETARHGPLALARVIGRACVIHVGDSSSHQPLLEDGTKVVLFDNALRLLGALRGDQRADLVRQIPDWLRLLASADERAGEEIPPDEAFMTPHSKWERSLFPVSWQVIGARNALWGALQCLLVEEGGLTVDDATRRDLVTLGEEILAHNPLERFRAPQSLLAYATEDVVRFAHPLPAFPELPAWFVKDHTTGLRIQ